MAFVVIDTIRFANILRTAGMPTEQAEAQALLLGELRKLHVDEQSATADLRREVESLRRELDALRAQRA